MTRTSEILLDASLSVYGSGQLAEFGLTSNECNRSLFLATQVS
jgi:hypothetical protein